jgi:hypothetical protein
VNATALPVHCLFAVVALATTARLGVAQTTPATGSEISLPFGIRLSVPKGWRTDRAEVAPFLSARGRSATNTISIKPEASGHLVTVAAPLDRAEEASFEISVMPTEVSQATVASMSPAEIARANQTFRSEIEGALRQSGLTLLSWEGTTRVPFGGRIALLTRYRFRYPDKPPMSMESYGVYLGRRSIQVRLQYSAPGSKVTKREVDRIRQSVRLALSSL